jgi:hypothetical protein
VRRAINRGCGRLEAFAGRVIEFDPKGGGSHIFILMFTTYGVASAAGKISCELIEVQPGATLFLTKYQVAHPE